MSEYTTFTLVGGVGEDKESCKPTGSCSSSKPSHGGTTKDDEAFSGGAAPSPSAESNRGVIDAASFRADDVSEVSAAPQKPVESTVPSRRQSPSSESLRPTSSNDDNDHKESGKRAALHSVDSPGTGKGGAADAEGSAVSVPLQDGLGTDSAASANCSAASAPQSGHGRAGSNSLSGTGLTPPQADPLPPRSIVPPQGFMFVPGYYYFPGAYPLQPFCPPDQGRPHYPAARGSPPAVAPTPASTTAQSNRATLQIGDGEAISEPASAAMASKRERPITGRGAASSTASTKRRKTAKHGPAQRGEDSSSSVLVPWRNAKSTIQVTGQESVTHRSDVPEDVKALVKFLRKQADKELKKLRKQVLTLQQALNDERKAHGELQAAMREAGICVSKKPTQPDRPEIVFAGATETSTAEARTAATLPPATTGHVSPSKSTSLPLPTLFQVCSKKEREFRGPSWTWDSAIEALRHFEKGNGHLRVPTRSHLGRWVMEIRANYKAWKAKQDKQANRNPNDPQETGQHPTQQHVQKPSEQPVDGYTCEDSNYLGPTMLTLERVSLLESLGFEWSLAPPKVPWNTRCDDLEAFCILHGHARVPRTGEYASLGEWVKGVRQYYKDKNPYLTPERIERLLKIPHFSLATETQKLSFDERLEECREFRRQNGHLGVYPLRNNPDMSKQERSFRWWAHNVRLAYRKFKMGRKTNMDAQKIKKLGEYAASWSNSDALGFVWDLPDLRRGKAADRKFFDDGGNDDDEEEEEDVNKSDKPIITTESARTETYERKL